MIFNVHEEVPCSVCQHQEIVWVTGPVDLGTVNDTKDGKERGGWLPRDHSN